MVRAPCPSGRWKSAGWGRGHGHSSGQGSWAASPFLPLFHLAKPPYPESISAKEFPQHLCLPATLCGVPAHSDGIWLEEFEAGLVVSVMPPESSPQVVWSWESPPRGHPRACCRQELPAQHGTTLPGYRVGLPWCRSACPW